MGSAPLADQCDFCQNFLFWKFLFLPAFFVKWGRYLFPSRAVFGQILCLCNFRLKWGRAQGRVCLSKGASLFTSMVFIGINSPPPLPIPWKKHGQNPPPKTLSKHKQAHKTTKTKQTTNTKKPKKQEHTKNQATQKQFPLSKRLGEVACVLLHFCGFYGHQQPPSTRARHAFAKLAFRRNETSLPHWGGSLVVVRPPRVTKSALRRGETSLRH